MSKQSKSSKKVPPLKGAGGCQGRARAVKFPSFRGSGSVKNSSPIPLLFPSFGGGSGWWAGVVKAGGCNQLFIIYK